MPTALFRPGDRPLVNLGLLVLTISTIFTTFLRNFSGGDELTPDRLIDAALFSFTVVAILGAHEMGHYLYARRHGVDTSLPYFIPFPLLGVGTLGAVIRIRSRIPDRNALVDIGAAGPLAGLVIAIPLMAIGLARSRVEDMPPLGASFPGELSLWRLGQELLQLLLPGAGPPPLEPVGTRMVTVFGDNLLMVLLQRLVLGPLPAGKEVIAHPMVIAGWFGLLMTMINLIPIGQLDGGHVSFALFGDRARHVGRVAALGLLGLCLVGTAGWLVWLLVATLVVGFKHPGVVVPEEPLTRGRKIVAALCLLAFVLCAMPVPISMVVLP